MEMYDKNGKECKSKQYEYQLLLLLYNINIINNVIYERIDIKRYRSNYEQNVDILIYYNY